jgi:hypothetical protein
MSNKVICDGYSENASIAPPHHDGMVLAAYHVELNNDDSNWGNDTTNDYCTDCWQTLLHTWRRGGFPADRTARMKRIEP